MSLSDLEIVGCKWTSAFHVSPSFLPDSRAMGLQIRQKKSSLGQFSLSTLQVRQPPSQGGKGGGCGQGGGHTTWHEVICYLFGS